MKPMLVIRAVVVIVGLLYGASWVVLPTSYENENGNFVLEYLLSDQSCIVMPHDRLWGQFPLYCVKKSAKPDFKSFRPKLAAK